MLRRQWCSSSLCLFFLFLLQRVSSTSLLTNPHYVNCSENIHCGDLTDINVTYPFRLLDSPSYCGYPGYVLNCNLDEEAAQLTIKFGEEDYTVQKIVYEESLIVVVDSHFMGTDCPSNFTNTTINSALFNYTSVDSNLTVYVNCIFQTKPPELQEIPCPSNSDGPKKSYYKLSYGPSTFLKNLNGNCDLTAAVAVHKVLEFDKALQGGFGLTWNSSMDWCLKCVGSGGVCGYNENQPTDHVCYCSDTNRLDSCVYRKHIDPYFFLQLIFLS